MDDIRIGFLDSLEFDDGKIRGAILVTNQATEPAEFRCTSSIYPTMLQKTLWGERLKGYVASQLIGKPILDAMSARVSLLIIRKPEFMELRSSIPVPIVQLLRDQELTLASPLTADNGDDQPSNERIGLMVIKAHRKYADDRTCAREILAESLRSHDLLEPFERIQSSLMVVQQQETANSAR